MRFRLVFSITGFILIIVGLTMLLPLTFALFTGELKEALAFVKSIIITSSLGFLIYKTTKYDGDMTAKEGVLVGSTGWLVIPIFGSLPYIFSGALPGWFDAYFEAISGFTTTGATVIDDVEAMARSILLWRSFTQWLGGMGILLVFVAIMPRPGVGSTRLLRAEIPGPMIYKIVPRISQHAKNIWIVYLTLTAAVVLMLTLSGLSFFDAFNHTFTSVSTGGFSTRNEGLASFDSFWTELVVFCVIVIGGGNFLAYYVMIAKKDFFLLFKDEEYRAYLLVLLAGFFIAVPLLTLQYFDNLFDAVRYGFFQVATLKTGTGHFTFDYDLWGSSVKTFLFILMFFGGCQYSTTGGIKMVRMLIAFKFALGETNKYLHPTIVYPTRVNNNQVPAEVVQNVVGFFILYGVFFLLTSFLLALHGFDILSSLTASAAIQGNVGPAMGLFGPLQTYSELPSFLKLWLSIVMVIGRLEIYPVLALLQVLIKPSERFPRG